MRFYRKFRSSFRSFIAVVGSTVMGGYFMLCVVACRDAPDRAPKSLSVDASAFEVTGEETDPTTVTFSNGKKSVTFIPMIHIGTPVFYKAVADKVAVQKKNGAVLYYEFIDFDALDENNKRKARALVGILPTPHQYDELAGDGYIGQPNDAFLGLVNDKDANVDVSALGLIDAYEAEFGPIVVTGPDATSDLGEMATVTQPWDNVNKIVIETRNQKVTDAITKGPDSNIVLLFGGSHGPGIFADLQARDPAWQRVK